jgi:hypothetical protein
MHAEEKQIDRSWKIVATLAQAESKTGISGNGRPPQNNLNRNRKRMPPTFMPQMLAISVAGRNR